MGLCKNALIVRGDIIDFTDIEKQERRRDYYICRSCKCDILAHDIIHECTYPGSLEEPAEWELKCPHCGSHDIHETTIALCEACAEVPVQDFGDYCYECLVAMGEALQDR